MEHFEEYFNGVGLDQLVDFEVIAELANRNYEYSFCTL